MTWVKLDDSFSEHPKVLALSVAQRWLCVEGLCYASRHLTDGFIPEGALTLFTRGGGAIALVQAGVWERVAGGYLIHDYLDYNPTRAKVLAEREAARRRKSRRTDAGSSPEVRPNGQRTDAGSSLSPSPSPGSPESLSPRSHGKPRASTSPPGEQEAKLRMHPQTAAFLRPLASGGEA